MKLTAEELKVIITAQTQGFSQQMGNVRNQIEKTTATAKRSSSVLSGLFKFVSVAAVSKALFDISKQAIDMASDLAEVQNVVDVAFGSMASDVDKFAKTTIAKFGMSELSAKQYASTFMAMGNGMGIAQKNGKDMAITLTGLAGDMASFYNVSQDVAATALNSIYTGETETLKKFGVVMSEVNLQEFAASQGITKKINAMTQAEKVALRYNYVMQATANAQGDFARTSGGWANQVRILQEQFKSLLGTLGGGLMQALTPLLTALNQILSYFIAIGNAIAKAFGGEAIKSSSANVASNVGGVASGLDNAATGAGNTAKGLDKAAKAAKELKRQTMKFDELNIMQDMSSGGSGSGGSGGGSGGSAGGGGVSSAYTESVAETEGALDGIAKKIQEFKESLPELKINFNVDEALKDLETIIENLKNIVKNFAHLILTITINILNDLDIGKLANKILHCIAVFTTLASTVSDILTPAIENFYKIALSPIVKWIGEKLANALDFLTQEFYSWSAWFDNHADQIKDFFDEMAKAVKYLWDLIQPVLDAEWETFKIVIHDIGVLLKDLFGWILDHKDGIAAAFKVIGTVMILGFVGPIGAIIILINKVDGAKKAFEDFKDGVKKAMDGFANGVGKAFDAVTKFFTETLPTKFNEAKDKIVGKFEEIKTGISDKAEAIRTAISTKFANVKETMVEKIEGAKSAVTTKFEAIKTAISDKVEGAKTAVVTKFEAIKTGIATKVDSIKTKVSTTFESVKSAITKPFETAKTTVINVIEKIKSAFNFQWKLPKMKLPHISITPAGWKVGDLLKGSIPKLGISWYAKGGIFDRASLIGVGEAGKEAVLPLEGENAKWMDTLVDKIVSRNGNSSPSTIVLTIDGKEFAKASVNSINDLTRQTGHLQLVLG